MLPFGRLGISGTSGSNPLSSSGESAANLPLRAFETEGAASVGVSLSSRAALMAAYSASSAGWNFEMKASVP
jgi:hypothetical protein